jgi:hypothetical protein
LHFCLVFLLLSKPKHLWVQSIILSIEQVLLPPRLRLHILRNSCHKIKKMFEVYLVNRVNEKVDLSVCSFCSIFIILITYCDCMFIGNAMVAKVLLNVEQNHLVAKWWSQLIMFFFYVLLYRGFCSCLIIGHTNTKT